MYAVLSSLRNNFARVCAVCYSCQDTSPAFATISRCCRRWCGCVIEPGRRPATSSRQPANLDQNHIMYDAYLTDMSCFHLISRTKARTFYQAKKLWNGRQPTAKNPLHCVGSQQQHQDKAILNSQTCTLVVIHAGKTLALQSSLFCSCTHQVEQPRYGRTVKKTTVIEKEE